MGPGVLRNRGGVVNKNRVLIYINSFLLCFFSGFAHTRDSIFILNLCFYKVLYI